MATRKETKTQIIDGQNVDTEVEVSFLPVEELVAKLGNSKFSPEDLTTLFAAMLEVIKDELNNYDEVDTPIGTFRLVVSEERTIKHPQTGESMTLPGKRTVRIQPSIELRKAIA
jgi:nucleoid DNA-binding protein